MPTPKPGHREGVRRYARAGQTTLPIRGTLVVAGPWQGWKVCPTCGRIYHPDALTCGNYCSQ